jgi:hypothetical protein
VAGTRRFRCAFWSVDWHEHHPRKYVHFRADYTTSGVGFSSYGDYTEIAEHSGRMVTPKMAADVQLSPPHGVMILSVGAADAGMLAGMMPRDVILDFAGVPVNGQTDMQRVLATVTPAAPSSRLSGAMMQRKCL